jgi:hypothetical protein
MMEGAEGDDIFVADLLAEAPTLGEAEMVGVGGLAIADQTWKLRDTPQMGLVADATLQA